MSLISDRNFFGFTWGSRRGKNEYITTPRMDAGFLQRGISYITGKELPKWISPTGQEPYIFDTTPELKVVVGTKAEMYSNGVYRHQKQTRGGEWEDIPTSDSEILALLNKPNVLQTKADFMMFEMTSSHIFGKSMRLINKPLIGDVPLSIMPLPMDRMMIEYTGKWMRATDISDVYKQFIYDYDGRNKEYIKPDEVIYKKRVNLSSIREGSSPLADLFMPISNIRAAYGFRNVYITKHGALGIISGINDDGMGALAMTAEDRKKLEDQYLNSYGSHDGQSTMAIVSGQIKYTPTAYKVKDYQLLEECEADMNIFIDYFGMNKNIFSKEKNSTFENVNEGKKSCYDDAIIPYANQEAEILSEQLGLTAKKERIIIDYSHVSVLQEDKKLSAETEKLKAEAYSILIATGKIKEEAESVIYGVK